MIRTMFAGIVTLAALVMSGVPASAASPSPTLTPATAPIDGEGDDNNDNIQLSSSQTVDSPPPPVHGPSQKEGPDITYDYQLCGGVQVQQFGSKSSCARADLATTCPDKTRLYQVDRTYADGSPGPTNYKCLGDGDFGSQLGMGQIVRAFKEIPLPESNISIQSAGGRAIVNAPVVFSTGGTQFTRDVTLAGNKVELLADPSTFTWLPGDGQSFTTDWRGRRYPVDSGADVDDYINYTYTHTSNGGTLPVRVDTTWTGWFRVNGETEWSRINTDVTVEGNPKNLPVIELRSHLMLPDDFSG